MKGDTKHFYPHPSHCLSGHSKVLLTSLSDSVFCHLHCFCVIVNQGWFCPWETFDNAGTWFWWSQLHVEWYSSIRQRPRMQLNALHCTQTQKKPPQQRKIQPKGQLCWEMLVYSRIAAGMILSKYTTDNVTPTQRLPVVSSFPWSTWPRVRMAREAQNDLLLLLPWPHLLFGPSIITSQPQHLLIFLAPLSFHPHLCLNIIASERTSLTTLSKSKQAN